MHLFDCQMVDRNR